MAAAQTIYHLYSDGELALTTVCPAQLKRRARREAEEALEKYGQVTKDTVYYTTSTLNIAGTTSGCKDFKFKLKVENVEIEESEAN